MIDNNQYILNRILPIIMCGVFTITSSFSILNESPLEKKLNIKEKRINTLQEEINTLKGKYILGKEFTSFNDSYILAILEEKMKKADSDIEKAKLIKEYQEIEKRLAKRWDNYDYAVEQVSIKKEELDSLKEELQYLKELLIINNNIEKNITWNKLEELEMPYPRLILLKPEEDEDYFKISKNNFDL